MQTLIYHLQTMDWWLACVLLLAENVALFLLTLGVGHLLVRRFQHRPVAAEVRERPYEWVLAGISVLLNTLVTIAGLALWREGIIVLRTTAGWRDWLDVPVLFLVMDLAMYVLHRMAHWPWLYPLLHRTHHIFEDPRPITLFALNPLENLSFGLLWLAVLTVYPASWLGVTIYLTLNLAFGLIGHLGVEPFPRSWGQIPVLKYISSSTFHAQHHQDAEHNFGFYTVIWDRLFRTLSPHYPAGLTGGITHDPE